MQKYPITEEIACIQRGDLTPETLGLTLAEAKDLLANVQANMVKEQTTEYVEQQCRCPLCGETRGEKGHHDIVFRSLFGKMEIPSPRLYACSCQPQEKKSFSPLAEHLPERTAPELLYLQTKWASLMSYGLTVEHLEEVLPIQVNVATAFRKMHTVAERVESELGDEQHNLKRNTNIILIQEALGHKSLTTTEKYTHFLREMMDEQLTKNAL